MNRPAIDPALVRLLLTEQFAHWADLAIAPVAAQGWDNRSFRLGETLLVRLPSAAHYASQVDKEAQWLPWLADRLPLPIPLPLARGAPGAGYRWPWSVRRWLAGNTATAAEAGAARFGRDLAGFLNALHALDGRDGPAPGHHNGCRGGSLRRFDPAVRRALARLDDRRLADRLAPAWAAALAARRPGPPVWLHGDIAPGNLLQDAGRLVAVIDFGNTGVGDPACDLAIGWSFLARAGRDGFRAAIAADADCWARGRGWALWKAAILAAGLTAGPAEAVADARRVLTEVAAAA